MPSDEFHLHLIGQNCVPWTSLAGKESRIVVYFSAAYIVITNTKIRVIKKLKYSFLTFYGLLIIYLHLINSYLTWDLFYMSTNLIAD